MPGARDAHLHPRRLDVLDVRMERQPADRVHQHGLAEGRAHAGLALECDRRLGGDEGQRHQLGEAAGVLLQAADAQQVARPVDRLLDMPEHDGGGRAQADAVGGTHDRKPLLGRDLVGAEDVAHFVVEDLGRRAGQAAEAGLAQLGEVVRDRALERRGAVPDLERREGMDMHAGHRLAHRAADFEIMIAGIFGMDAALHADFGGAALPGFRRAAHDLLGREVVGRAAQVGRQLAFGEGAEAAAEVADVGVVDVAHDGVRHGVADHLAPQRIGGLSHRREIAAASGEQTDDVSFAEIVAARRAVDKGGEAGTRPHRRPRQRLDVGLRQLHHQATPPLAHRQRARPQGRIDPAFVLDIARIDREPLGQHFAVGCTFGRKGLELRPWPLGIHVVGRDGGDTAPIVDAGLDQPAIARLLQVGRRLDRQRVAEDEARDGHGPQKLVERRLGCSRHARIGLGAEILDDDFLQMAMIAMQVTQRQQRLDPFGPCLADADQDAAGEWHLGLAGGLDRRQPQRRHLVRGAEVGPAAFAQPRRRGLQHDAHGDRRLAQPRKVSRLHQAGIEMRQQPGFLEHQIGHSAEIVERRGVTHCGQRLGRRLPFELRFVAQGEQCLGATGGLSGARNLEHLLGAEVSRLAALGRMDEGAVAARVAAEMRQRNEHLLGEGDALAERGVADRRRLAHQRGKVA